MAKNIVTVKLLGYSFSDSHKVEDTVECEKGLHYLELGRFRQQHPELDNIVAAVEESGITVSRMGVNWCQKWIDDEVKRAMSYEDRGISYLNKIYYNKSAAKEWRDRNAHLESEDYLLYKKNNAEDSDKCWYASLISNM